MILTDLFKFPKTASPGADRKEKGGTPGGARQGNVCMLNNTNIPKRVYMSVEQWTDILDNPRQRDTEKHAKNADHLRNPHPIHAIVNMATLPDGRQYKLDGHTRSLLWSTGQVEPPPQLIVDCWQCGSLEDVKHLYECFDSKGAAENTNDRMFGAYRENGIEFKSPLLATRRIAAALRTAYSFLHGSVAAKNSTEYDLVEYWLPELYMLDEVNPAANLFPTAVTWAALITFRRYGNQASDFWERYSHGRGNKIGNERDAVQALTERVNSMRGDRALTATANITYIGGICFSAFMSDRAGRNYTQGIKALGKESMADWSLAAKKAKKAEV